jgi:hypothetical protein
MKALTLERLYEQGDEAREFKRSWFVAFMEEVDEG